MEINFFKFITFSLVFGAKSLTSVPQSLVPNFLLWTRKFPVIFLESIILTCGASCISEDPNDLELGFNDLDLGPNSELQSPVIFP